MKTQKQFERHQAIKYSILSMICVVFFFLSSYLNELIQWLLKPLFLTLPMYMIGVVYKSYTDPELYLNYLKKYRIEKKRKKNIQNKINKIIDESRSNKQN